ncbi:hypothetical protein OXX79_013659, partial [Metschnikowia pulcherrima]
DVPDVASFRSSEVAILDAGIDATLDVRLGAISEVDGDAFAVDLDTVSVLDVDSVLVCWLPSVSSSPLDDCDSLDVCDTPSEATVLD